MLWGDQIMILFSRALLAEQPGAAIVGEVKCSMTLYDDIAKRGGRAIMWKAGHSLIKAKMKEEKALLAGEMSGHIFFAHRWFGFDDGDLLVGAPRRAALPDRRSRSRRCSPTCPQHGVHAGAARGLPRGEEVRGRAARPGVLRGALRAVTVDGVRVVFPGRLGPRPRVQHAAAARAALRGDARRSGSTRSRRLVRGQGATRSCGSVRGVGRDGRSRSASIPRRDERARGGRRHRHRRDRRRAQGAAPRPGAGARRRGRAPRGSPRPPRAAGVTAGAVGAVGVGVAGQCLGRDRRRAERAEPGLAGRRVRRAAPRRDRAPGAGRERPLGRGLGREALRRGEGASTTWCSCSSAPASAPASSSAGRLYDGAQGVAGEFGHVKVRPLAPRDRGAALRLRPARLPRGVHLRRERGGARARGDRRGRPDRDPHARVGGDPRAGEREPRRRRLSRGRRLRAGALGGGGRSSSAPRSRTSSRS